LYFRALLEMPQLFARGLLSIMSGRPHGYYRCLLELPDLQPLLAIQDADVCTMTNAQFLGMLKGQVPNFDDAPLALEDAHGGLLALQDGHWNGAGAIADQPSAPPRAHEVVGPVAAGADEFDELQTVDMVTHTMTMTTLSNILWACGLDLTSLGLLPHVGHRRFATTFANRRRPKAHNTSQIQTSWATSCWDCVVEVILNDVMRL
jgi:hypothetical protein